MKEKKIWKRRALDLQNQNRKLLEQTMTLQRCLQSQIFNLEARFKFLPSGGPASPAGSEMAQIPLEGDDERHDLPETPPALRSIPHAEPTASQPAQTEAQKPNFSYTEDGFFHLKDGFCISGAQAAKICADKKGTLVCKDTVQGLWSNTVLATRSVSGNVAPRKRALGELPKQQFTPKKVDVVVVTIQHWGQQKNVDVRHTQEFVKAPH
ncbi:uncharacterized protein [Dermacentor andersoni]|uniref:uncharacterized protein isoform X1 n=1 Tax=Dermacentor andersoni TaxID=34620 RepID=UPI00241713C8|nr:uncharacterized protein LOC129383081 [Dermacentor andersoni]